jgi:hypothetical protein
LALNQTTSSIRRALQLAVSCLFRWFKPHALESNGQDTPRIGTFKGRVARQITRALVGLFYHGCQNSPVFVRFSRSTAVYL